MVERYWLTMFVCITVVARLFVPREEGPGVVRPFDVSASDVNVLLELKPEGKVWSTVTLTSIA